MKLTARIMYPDPKCIGTPHIWPTGLKIENATMQTIKDGVQQFSHTETAVSISLQVDENSSISSLFHYDPAQDALIWLDTSHTVSTTEEIIRFMEERFYGLGKYGSVRDLPPPPKPLQERLFRWLRRSTKPL